MAELHPELGSCRPESLDPSRPDRAARSEHPPCAATAVRRVRDPGHPRRDGRRPPRRRPHRPGLLPGPRGRVDRHRPDADPGEGVGDRGRSAPTTSRSWSARCCSGRSCSPRSAASWRAAGSPLGAGLLVAPGRRRRRVPRCCGPSAGPARRRARARHRRRRRRRAVVADRTVAAGVADVDTRSRPRPTVPSRRGVLVAAGVLAAAAAALGGAGRLDHRPAHRRRPTSPARPRRPGPGVPAGLRGQGARHQLVPDADQRLLPRRHPAHPPDRRASTTRRSPSTATSRGGHAHLRRPRSTMTLIERDITLTCVSNDVGGPYVGGARWLGVRLTDLLDRAGVGSTRRPDPRHRRRRDDDQHPARRWPPTAATR